MNTPNMVDIKTIDIMLPDRLGLNMSKEYDFSVVEKLA